MRWLLVVVLVVLVVGCGPQAAAVQATPTVEPTASPTPRHAVVAVTFASYGADAFTTRLAEQLPAAWLEATGGRSRAVVLPKGGIPVYVVGGAGQSWSYNGPAVPHIIVLHESAADGFVDSNGTKSRDVLTLMHEMGHQLGCCTGPSTEGGHFVGEPVGLMTSPVRCARCVFTEREMRAIFE